MKSVAVAGATGYLGRKACAALRARGVEPWVLVRPETDPSRMADLTSRPPVRWPDDPFPAVDVLLILGTLFSGQTLAGQAPLIVEANVLRPVRLAEAHLQAGGRCVVATGSCWEFVRGASDAVNSYAASKIAARTMLGAMAAERRASICWLALSDTFGADDPRPKVFGAVRDALRSGVRLAMTAGEQPFDPVDAADAARAIALSCLADEPQGVWGVAGGEPASLRDKIEAYCDLVGRPSPCDWGAKPYRFGEPVLPDWKAPPPWWRPAASFADSVLRMEGRPGGLLGA